MIVSQNVKTVFCVGGDTWKKNTTGNNWVCMFKAGNFKNSDCAQIDWSGIKIKATWCNTKDDDDIQSYIKPEFLNQSAGVSIKN